MVSNDPTNKPAQPQAFPLHAPAAGAADPSAIMDPGGTIETAAQGSGPVNDPPASDNKPPGVTDYNFDLLA